MKTDKEWLSFEIDRENHEFLQFFSALSGKSQKEIVNEIITDFKNNTMEYLEEIAKKQLEETNNETPT